MATAHNPPLQPPLDVAPTCSFCLSGATADMALIRPCNCRTCHRACLNEWRSFHRDDRFFHECEICRYKYTYEPIPPESAWTDFFQRLMVYSTMLLSAAFIIGATQGGATLIAFVLRGSDTNHKMADSISSSNPWLSYWLYGNLIFFFLVGLVALVVEIRCRNQYTRGAFYSYRPNNISILDCFDCFNCRYDCECGRNKCCGDTCDVFAVMLIILVALIGVVSAVFITCEMMFKVWWRFNDVFIKKQQAQRTFVVKDLNAMEPVELAQV